jgi:microcystin-dependent protein
MAISVKISQLNDGGSISSADYIPAARGADTVKVNAQQFVVNGSNIGIGPGQLFSGTSSGAGTTMQFRTLSGADGITVGTSGNTLVVSASGQNPVKTSLTGNGTTTIFAINGANSINANNYRVDIDGVLQEPLTDYTINGSNIVFNPAPPNGSKVTVVSNNLVRAYDIVPSDGSVTIAKLITEIQNALLPTGAVMSFYRTTAPSGWLVCDGTAIPAQFTALIALVGANTPNLQGQFIRGLTTNLSTASRDPLSGSRVLGNVQNDAFKSHTHSGNADSAGSHTHLSFGGSGINGGRYSFAETGIVANNIQYAANQDGRGSFVQTAGAHEHTLTIDSQGNPNETRPVNIALLYCIKT